MFIGWLLVADEGSLREGTVLSVTKTDFGRVNVDCEVVLERCGPSVAFVRREAIDRTEMAELEKSRIPPVTTNNDHLYMIASLLK